MSRTLRALLFSFLGALMLGCAEVPTRPAPIALTLALSLSTTEGSYERPILIGATVLNSGSRRVFHIAGCGCDAIVFEIRDQNGEQVAYWNPCMIWPACPCGPEPLEPGERIAGGLAFGGVYRVPTNGGTCELVDIPAGVYTVIARFGMSTEPFGPWRTIERSATFRWAAS